jgi:putative Holliday junction resolvase
MVVEARFSGRVLALDVGERRVGIAISDETQTLARSLTVLQRRSKTEDFEALIRLVQEQDVAVIVVGLPLLLDGTEGPQARRIRCYAEALTAALVAQNLKVTIAFFDESHSTATATEIMIASGRKRLDRRRRVDAVAAAVILQDYLDARSSNLA